MGSIERITERLEKPELDDRSYRVVRLANKLEALLVHDPDTDKASAAVNVNVGNFSDADDMPGMAHAVEHLLFMGTEKVSRPRILLLCRGPVRKLTRAPAPVHVVPGRERIQPVPSSPLRFVECVHGRDGDQLFL